LAAAWLLLVFVAYYANVTCFTHSHTINGTTIVHSHFHHAGHAGTDHHSPSEVTLIAALSLFQTTAAAAPCAMDVRLALLATMAPHVCLPPIYCRYAALPSLRAPPAQ